MSKDIKIILLFFMLTYLLGLSFRPLISPDETRYAEISREMISSGDLVVPHLNGLRYFEKPIMGYWLNSISMLVFGQNRFGIRLASAFAVLITALSLYFLTRKEFNAKMGLFAALAYMATVAVFISGTVAILDSMLTAALTCAAVLFYFAFHSPTWKKRLSYLALFGLLIGIAFLIKGFLIFVVLGLTTGSYLIWEFSQDKFKRLKQHSLAVNAKLAALMVLTIALPLLVVTLPWSIMIYLKEPDFWRFFFIEEHLQRFMAKDAQHPEPFFFYLPVLLIALMPWTLLLPIVASRWQSFKLNIPLIKYSLCWFLLPLLFFSISKGKLPTYILPTIPPLIILLTFGFEKFIQTPDKWLKWLHGVTKVFIGLLITAVSALIILQFTGIPGMKTAAGANLTIFTHSEWWKLGLIIAIVTLSIIILLRVRACNDISQKLYCFMSGIALFLVISLIAVPTPLLAAKMSGQLLLKEQELLDEQSIIIADYRLTHAICWFYQRDDIYLLFFANEFGYGINYSAQTKQRRITKNNFPAFIQQHSGHIVVILTLKHYYKYRIKHAILPPPKQLKVNRAFAILEY